MVRRGVIRSYLGNGVIRSNLKMVLSGPPVDLITQFPRFPVDLITPFPRSPRGTPRGSPRGGPWVFQGSQKNTKLAWV